MIQSCLNESGRRLKDGGTYFKVTGINLIYHDFVVVMHFGSATIWFLSYEVSWENSHNNIFNLML